MDLNVVSINSIGSTLHARSVSPDRRQQYRAEGRCVRYGSQDHWVKDYMLQPFSLGKPKTNKVTIAALDNNTYED
jgi:hypothetical protein